MASATIGSNGPSLLPSGLLRLLGALWLRFLRALLWLLALRLLGALWLRFLRAQLWLLALRLLGALWLRFLRALLWLLALRLLGALWLRFLRALLWLLALRLLGALWLRFLRALLWLLALRLLGFSAASALFLLAFLCECRNGGAEKQKQNCCADNSTWFHRWCLRLMSHLPLAGFSRHTSYTVCAHGCQFT
jgi:hypothetical protein